MSSATFPEKLQELAGKYMRNYIFVITGTGGVNPDISQEFLEVTKKTRKSILITLLKNFNRVKIIVFVESKRTADFLAATICNCEFNLQVIRYHIL